jgi:very-short-patch-repair endonuclease
VALLLPAGALVGGLSAAAWYGAPLAAATDPVTVLRRQETRWSGPRGVRVHCTRWHPSEEALLDDVPLTTPLRTAWEVAALESVGTAVAVLDAMVRAGHLALPQLHELARERAGRWGVTRVRRAIPLVDPRAESAPESRVRVALQLAGLAPVPQHEVRVGGRFVARVDLAWPEARLALEYEGAYHFADAQLVRDDERIARLRAAGWRVIRVSAADLRDLADVVDRVRAALRPT